MSFIKGVCTMNTLFRILSGSALLASITWMGASFTQGETGKSTPVVTTDAKVNLAKAGLADPVPDNSKFAKPLLVYQPIKGGLDFSFMLKPKLEPTPRLPRDIAILVSTSAAQAGEGWVAST